MFDISAVSGRDAMLLRGVKHTHMCLYLYRCEAYTDIMHSWVLASHLGFSKIISLKAEGQIWEYCDGLSLCDTVQQ